MARELEAAIPVVVEEHGPITAPEIAALLDAHPVTVRRHCTKLQQADRIRRGCGGYVGETHPSGQPTASD